MVGRRFIDMYKTAVSKKKNKEDWLNFISEDILKYIGKPKQYIFDLEADDRLDKDLPILQFRASDGVTENICNVEGFTDACTRISSILKNADYKSHYIRTHIKDNVMYLDYGSHTSKFKIINADKLK